MDIIGFLKLYFELAWPAILGIGLIYYFTHNNFRWHWAEVLILIIPYLLWLLLAFTGIKPKSWGNIINELKILSYLLVVINLISASYFNKFKFQFDLIGSIILTILLWFCYPHIPGL